MPIGGFPQDPGRRRRHAPSPPTVPQSPNCRFPRGGDITGRRPFLGKSTVSPVRIGQGHGSSSLTHQAAMLRICVCDTYGGLPRKLRSSILLRIVTRFSYLRPLYFSAQKSSRCRPLLRARRVRQSFLQTKEVAAPPQNDPFAQWLLIYAYFIVYYCPVHIAGTLMGRRRCKRYRQY